MNCIAFHLILTMAARDYDTDVDDPLAIDVVQGTNENENELETSRGSKKPR